MDNLQGVTSQLLYAIQNATPEKMPVISDAFLANTFSVVFPSDVTVGRVLDILREYFDAVAVLAEDADTFASFGRHGILVEVNLPPKVESLHPNIGVKIRNVSSVKEATDGIPPVFMFYGSGVGQYAERSFLASPEGAAQTKSAPSTGPVLILLAGVAFLGYQLLSGSQGKKVEAVA